MKLTHDQKEQVIAGIRLMGTKKAGAMAANITIETLNEELKKSAILKKRVSEALQVGKSNLGENAIDIITTYALNPPPQTDRNQLTAAIALANAFIPGFRGATTVQGKIEHDIKVISAVPRPNYLPEPPKQLEKPKTKMVKKEILDDKGEIIGYQTVEEAVDKVIEGEFVERN